MVVGLLLIVATGLLWGLVGVIYSAASRRQVDPISMPAISATLTSVTSWVFLADHRALWRGDVPRLSDLAIAMVLSGLFAFSGVLAMQGGLRRGHHGAVWTIAQSALLLPFLAGIAWFGEPVAPHRVAGVAALLACLALLGLAKQPAPAARPAADATDAQASPIPAPVQDLAAQPAAPLKPTRSTWFLFALLAFACLGMHQALMTLPTHWDGFADVARLRLPFFFTTSAAGYVGSLLVLRRPLDRRAWPFGLALGLNSVVSQNLFLMGMDRLRPFHLVSLAYPLGIGICIVSFALYSLLALRERVSPTYLAGLACGMLGLAAIAA